MTGILKVINVSGIKYAFNHKGRAIVIPYDERVYILPNDVDRSQFGNAIKILQEIINIQKEPVIMVEPQPIQSDNNIIEIDLDDAPKFEPITDVGDITVLEPTQEIDLDVYDAPEFEPVIDVEDIGDIGNVTDVPIEQKQERTPRTTQTKHKRGYTKKAKAIESKQSF